MKHGLAEVVLMGAVAQVADGADCENPFHFGSPAHHAIQKQVPPVYHLIHR